LKRLELAIDCPYVSAKSLQALNQAYVYVHARSRQGSFYMQVAKPSTSLSLVLCLHFDEALPMPIKRKRAMSMGQDWARILVKANRTAEGCEVYEQLASTALTSNHSNGKAAAFAEQAAHQCLAAIQEQQGATLQ
jgi:hypothetical protein